MAKIDAVFHRLQIVAFLQPLGDETLRWIDLGPLQRRRRWLHGGWTHVSPHDSGFLDAGVRLQLDVLAKAALFGLGRQVDALPGHVIFPAVIGAAQAAFLILAEPERDAAMCAKLVDQADAPFTITKTNQAFAHQLGPYGWAIGFGNFRRQQKRRPIAAEQFAHQGARTDTTQLIVLLTRHHGDVFPDFSKWRMTFPKPVPTFRGRARIAIMFTT